MFIPHVDGPLVYLIAHFYVNSTEMYHYWLTLTFSKTCSFRIIYGAPHLNGTIKLVSFLHSLTSLVLGVSPSIVAMDWAIDFVSILSHKLFRLVYKPRTFSFQSNLPSLFDPNTETCIYFLCSYWLRQQPVAMAEQRTLEHFKDCPTKVSTCTVISHCQNMIYRILRHLIF